MADGDSCIALYQQQGKTAWAITHLEHHLELDPDAPEAAEIRGSLAQLRGRLKPARPRSAQPNLALRPHTEAMPPPLVLGARNQGQTGVEYDVPVMTYRTAHF